jgi:hypothetical protein
MAAKQTGSCKCKANGSKLCTCVSYRWNVAKGGKEYILYGDLTTVRKIARKLEMSLPTPSGYYSYATNTLHDVRDGDSIIIDNSDGRLGL